MGNSPVSYSDVLGLAKQFWINFVREYDEFLRLEKQLEYLNIKFEKAYYRSWDFDYLKKLRKERDDVYNQVKVQEKLVKEMHYSRNKYNLDLPKTLEEAESNWNEPDLLGFNYPASFYHQDININWFERKFVSPDWHREIIFSKKWEEITSNEYWGTYNIYAPSNKGLHIKYDINPYNKWWNWDYLITN